MKKINIVLMMLWFGIINEALILNLKIDDGIDTMVENDQTIVNSEELLEDVKKIRVLLMNDDYTSYYHPFVAVQYDGKQETYTLDSQLLNDDEIIIECDKEGIVITSINRQEGNPLYQGSLEIHKKEEGLLLINEIPVETYLESVVPSEMPASYEKEALKAQAVCARTYAYKQIEKSGLPEYEADVDDSVNYQVYGNIATQKNTNSAVRETEGEVLVHQGELIEAYYFSTSSGMTSTTEVWGAVETASYLKSVECDFDSGLAWSEWEVNIPWNNLETRLKDFSEHDAKILNLQIKKKSESGAVIEMDVITKADTITFCGEYDVREFLSPEKCMIINKNGEKTSAGTLLPSAYFDMEITPGEFVHIKGRGYGHGIGMSQNAANEMAKKGYSYDEILAYFFEDIEIKEYKNGN